MADTVDLLGPEWRPDARFSRELLAEAADEELQELVEQARDKIAAWCDDVVAVPVVAVCCVVAVVEAETTASEESCCCC